MNTKTHKNVRVTNLGSGYAIRLEMGIIRVLVITTTTFWEEKYTERENQPRALAKINDQLTLHKQIVVRSE